VRKIEYRVGRYQIVVCSPSLEILDAIGNSTVDLHRKVIAVAVQTSNVAQRVRRQIVDGVIRQVRVQINGAARDAINRIPGVPVPFGGAGYNVGATTSLERNRATSKYYIFFA